MLIGIGFNLLGVVINGCLVLLDCGGCVLWFGVDDLFLGLGVIYCGDYWLVTLRDFWCLYLGFVF